jgi:rare lipoprotein A
VSTRVALPTAATLLALVAVAAGGCSTGRFVAETARAMQERSAGSADPTRLGHETLDPAGGGLKVMAVEEGVASWYGAGAHGNRTASGEIFDRRGMTAAHNSFPLASTVRVTNLDNGRQVMLRVNDRGIMSEGRIIDVSERAAELLGFKSAGITEVRVELMEATGQAASAE